MKKIEFFTIICPNCCEGLHEDCYNDENDIDLCQCENDFHDRS